MSKNNNFDLQKSVHKHADTVIFDLDGTLADEMKYEKHHKGINGKHPKFAKEALNVPVIEDMVEKLRKEKDDGKNVVILTARSAHYRPETKQWLHKNNIPYDALVMRPTDNTEKDKKVKKELLKEDILPKLKVEDAWDDKKKNRKMYESMGIDAHKVD
jgi:hydroxymethylpyrimidine pyrophosphatase-like HAD family hydrolase